MVNYKRKLEPEKFDFIQDEIDDRFDNPFTPNWVKYSAVAHRIASTQIDYHSSGKTVSRPDEMLDFLSGDCQDQTVLLSSMYVAAGPDVRIISVEKMGEDKYHVLPQVKIPVNPGTGTDELRDGYEELFDFRPGKMAWTTINGEPYFIADPGWSDYLGDRSSLTGSYIRETSDGWTWNNIRKEWRVDGVREPGKVTANHSNTNSSSRSQKSGRGFFDQLDEVAETIAEEI
jgi:hypothetical protein